MHPLAILLREFPNGGYSDELTKDEMLILLRPLILYPRTFQRSFIIELTTLGGELLSEIIGINDEIYFFSQKVVERLKQLLDIRLKSIPDFEIVDPSDCDVYQLRTIVFRICNQFPGKKMTIANTFDIITRIFGIQSRLPFNENVLEPIDWNSNTINMIASNHRYSTRRYQFEFPPSVFLKIMPEPLDDIDLLILENDIEFIAQFFKMYSSDVKYVIESIPFIKNIPRTHEGIVSIITYEEISKILFLSYPVGVTYLLKFTDLDLISMLGQPLNYKDKFIFKSVSDISLPGRLRFLRGYFPDALPSVKVPIPITEGNELVPELLPEYIQSFNECSNFSDMDLMYMFTDHISFGTFFELLLNSVTLMNVFHYGYSVYSISHKSNKWVKNLITPFLWKNSNIKSFLYADDGIYSGTQLEEYLEAKQTNIILFVVANMDNLRKTLNSIDELGDIDIYISSKMIYYESVSTVYFDHKIPDKVSSYYDEYMGILPEDDIGSGNPLCSTEDRTNVMPLIQRCLYLQNPYECLYPPYKRPSRDVEMVNLRLSQK